MASIRMTGGASVDSPRRGWGCRACPGERPFDRRAYTLVEMIIALALSGVVLGLLLTMRFQWVRGVGETQRDDTAELATFHIRLHEMVKEIQEGTRLFYPPAGKSYPGDEGLGFVNSSGQTVLYYMDSPYDPDPTQYLRKPRKLYRVNVNLVLSDPSERNKSAQPYLEGIEHFLVNVAPAAFGKEPSLVNLDIALQTGTFVKGTGQRPQVTNYVTSVFLRNLERKIPDDPNLGVALPGQ
jgi:prepilin-type N-terminal cleavage/methylation domain-containing protein